MNNYFYTLSLLITFILIQSPILTLRQGQNNTPSLAKLLTGPNFKEIAYDAPQDVSELEMIQELCPEMQSPICTFQELNYIKSIFDLNLGKLKNLKNLIHSIIKKLSAMSEQDRSLILNELKNGGQLEINKSDPRYSSFIRSLDYLVTNAKHIHGRIEAAFRFSSEINAAFFCGLFETENQNNISVRQIASNKSNSQSNQIQLEMRVDSANCKEILFRPEAYHLLQLESDLNEIYNVMTPISTTVDKEIKRPFDFISKEQLPALKVILEKCQILENFGQDTECTGICKRLAFNNDSIFQFIDQHMMAFSIILGNRQMRENEISSDQKDIEKYQNLQKSASFSSFLDKEHNQTDENIVGAGIITIADNLGLNFANFMNAPFDIIQKLGYNEYPLEEETSKVSGRKHASLSESYSFSTSQLNYERDQSPHFDLSQSVSKIENDMSVKVILEEAYNHSQNSLSSLNFDLLFEPEKHAKKVKDNDEDLTLKQNNKSLLIIE